MTIARYAFVKAQWHADIVDRAESKKHSVEQVGHSVALAGRQLRLLCFQ